jgi:hypothetical protein
VPASNLASELKSGALHPAHRNVPCRPSCMRGAKHLAVDAAVDGRHTQQHTMGRHPTLRGRLWSGIHIGSQQHQQRAAATAQGGDSKPRTVYRGLERGASVTACRSVAYCAGVSSPCHSSSLCATLHPNVKSGE